MGLAVSVIACDRGLADAALGDAAGLASALRCGENLDGDVGVVRRFRRDRDAG